MSNNESTSNGDPGDPRPDTEAPLDADPTDLPSQHLANLLILNDKLVFSTKICSHYNR